MCVRVCARKFLNSKNIFQEYICLFRPDFIQPFEIMLQKYKYKSPILTKEVRNNIITLYRNADKCLTEFYTYIGNLYHNNPEAFRK